MNKSKKALSVFLAVCLLLALLPTAALAQTDDFTGDIYVFNGQYTCWNGDYEDFVAADVPADDWISFDAANPITSGGEAINRNMYVLDETELYFGDLNLGSGAVYSYSTYIAEYDGKEHYCDLNFEGGILKAAAIDAHGEIWIEAEISLFVDGDVISDDYVDTFGCTLDVGGDIQAPYVYFDSDHGPLFVTVGGDIIAYTYNQEGGSVTVAGDITVEYFPNEQYPTLSDCQVDYDKLSVMLFDDYCDYNFTELKVGGSISAYNEIGIGYEHYYFDNQYLGQVSNDYPEIPVVLHVAGDLEAGDEIAVGEGNITVGGAIRTINGQAADTIYIFGGKIQAGEIESATRLFIGASSDTYELNDTIEIDVTGDISAADEITIFGGSVTADGTIQTTSEQQLDTIYIFGGAVNADAISSVTSIFIGDDDNSFETNDEILVYVTDGITAVYNMDIFGGTVYAGSVACDYFVIYNKATLFDAVNSDGCPDPVNYDVAQLQRTTLSDLIPGGMADFRITYGEGEESYTKTFTATADEDGEVVVWLPEGYTGGTAAYKGLSDYPFTADQELDFSALEGYQTASIGISVPDAVFDVNGGYGPWEDVNYLDPALWTFTGSEGSVASFSTASSAYHMEIYRNGKPYTISGGFLEGDYLVSVTTQQTIGEIPYVAAGTAEFTIKPLVITVKANNVSVNVGAALPAFAVSISDNGDGQYADDLAEDCSKLFYGTCYGNTASVGSFPIYARADCEAYNKVAESDPSYNMVGNPYFEDYAECLSGYLFWLYSIQFNLVNGVFSVNTADTGSTNSYKIAVKAGDGGSISPTTTQVVEYDTKTYAITPDEGYAIGDVLVDGVSVGAVAKYVFKMVMKDHTIEAKFVPENEEHNCPSLKFIDLNTSLWYHQGIDFVLLAGFFKGVTSNTFEPNSPMTRAMMVTVLYRLENTPAITSANPFKDVESGKWYTSAVIWAAGKGIVKGYDADTFGPEDNITREQIATILFRYAQYKGYDVSVGEDTNILSYDDALAISEYAVSAMQWACGAGLIKGRTESTLVPLGTATRAEVATMFMRFIQNVAE